MKNNGSKIFLIILLSIISISIIVFMAFLLTGSFKFKNIVINHRTNNELVLDTTYDIDFNKINIDAKSSDIYIHSTHSNETRVVIYGDKDEITYNTDNNELSINTQEKSCIGFCFNVNVSKVEIYLPENYNNTIEIDDDYGNVVVEKFINSTIRIENDCGDVKVNGGKVVKIHNDYGDISLGYAEVADISDACGDIDIEQVIDLTAENNYGNISIGNIKEKINVRNDCGDIKISNLNIVKDSYIKDNLGDITIGKTNDIYIDAKTDLGSVDINKNIRKSSVVLKIENDCGDIEVNN